MGENTNHTLLLHYSINDCKDVIKFQLYCPYLIDLNAMTSIHHSILIYSTSPFAPISQNIALTAKPNNEIKQRQTTQIKITRE